MKNKFFAFFILIPASIFVFILCVSAFFIIVAVDGFPKPIFLLLIFVIFLLVLPAFLLISGIIVGCTMIEITEEGIATVLFGKKLKYFKWEEITETETNTDGNAKQYIAFYRNKENTRRKKKEKISFAFYCLDQSRMTALKRYAPDYIMDKLSKKDN